ncbi:MAG: DUF1294 domain-containing protein [Ruminococcaceae bacterium]|nr:DUF1294 domain-containing protein [Oscillospiraceae bacterium]
MKELLILIAVYLLIINLDGFLLMRSDKKRAIMNKRRIPEASLMTVALLGGGPGVYWGMKTYRHKTLHAKFSIGVPLIIFFDTALLVVLLYFLAQSK